MTEDSSQTIAPTPEDSSLGQDTHVTAAAPAADNATLSTNQQVPQQQTAVVDAGLTGEGVDENSVMQSPAQKLASYEERRAAFLAAPKSAPTASAQAASTATPPAPAPTQTATPPAQTVEDEEFPTVPDAGGRMPKIKMQPVTPVDVQMMSEFKASQKAGNKASFVEFIQARLGTPAPASAASTEAAPNANTQTQAATNTGEPRTVKDLDALLTAKKEERRTCLNSLDFDRVIEIEGEEEALRAKRDVLLRGEAENRTKAAQAWEAQETEYLARVGAMFPQSRVATDPLVSKASQILQEWYDAGDPRAQHPSRAMYCYIEAAGELGVSPNAAPATQNQPSPPPPVRRAPITAVIASGSANQQQQSREQVDTRTYEERRAALVASYRRSAA